MSDTPGYVENDAIELQKEDNAFASAGGREHALGALVTASSEVRRQG